MSGDAPLQVHRTWLGSCPLLGRALFVWVQGCPRRCDGCFNVEALSFDGGSPTSTSELAQRCSDQETNLVLSGGEPFSHAERLASLCIALRARRPDAEIMAYTGFRLEELLRARDRSQLALLRQLDVLIDGPYEQSRSTDHALMGSDNQRVVLLSSRVDPSRVEALEAPRISVSLVERNLRLVGTGSARLSMQDLVRRIEAEGLRLKRVRSHAE